MRTLDDLLDVEQIKVLKARYFRCLDTKDWDGVASCFTPEATASYPQQACGSRDEIIAFLSTSMFAGLVSMHHGHHPEIEVDGDTATGTWYLHDKVFVPDFDFALEGAAIYSDRYARTDDGWRMTHTGYERIFETTWKPSDPTSYKVEQGRISRGPA